MKLRSNLLLLVAGAIVPVIGLTIVLASLLVEYEKDAFRQAATDRNRAFVSAIDAEVRGHIATLNVLAASEHLASGNLEAFHAETVRALAAQPDWQNVVLLGPERQLVNALAPFNPRLPRAVEVESVRRVFDTARPAVGGITHGRIVNAFGIPIRVPVMRGGKVAYVLTAVVQSNRLAELMQEQRYPSGWAVGIVDASGLFIARIPVKAVGQSTSKDFRNAIQTGAEGWFRGTTLEGVDTFTAYLTSPFTHWTVGVAVPASQVYAVAYRVAWTIALGGLACLALAMGFAYWMGRRIARPIVNLASAARALGSEGASRPVQDETAYEEVHELAGALDSAASAIREREALRESERDALRAADKAKDEFLAMLGHELRNPLSAISAAAHLVRFAKPGSDSAVQAHVVIERQTRQMTRLIEDLLDVSRLAMGKVTLRRESLELADLAARAARTWQHARQLPATRLRIEASRVWVDADRARIEQVIANLLDNADKFSGRDTEIVLCVREEGGDAVLEVTDQGEGIAPELLDRVFDLFVQGPQRSDRARGGMGLGLTLVQRLVDLHDGSIAVRSDGSGKGARFTVRLPAVMPGAPTVADEEDRSPCAASCRVLVVEDNDDGRAMLEQLLRMEGHVVSAAASGEEALARAAEWSPQAAIVDIGLPDMDGYEVARRLRKGARGHIKLIALTGYGQDRDQRRAYEAGFDVHLTKPVDALRLREALGVAIPERTGRR